MEEENSSASAGSRTRINCLEGNYASHYTTDAAHSIVLERRATFPCHLCMSINKVIDVIYNLSGLLSTDLPILLSQELISKGLLMSLILFIILSWGEKKDLSDQDLSCIGRESNPGRPRGRRAFYHWTTDASHSSAMKRNGKIIMVEELIVKIGGLQCENVHGSFSLKLIWTWQI